MMEANQLMEDNQLITSFTNVVKEQDYVFTNVSRSEIEILQKQLKETQYKSVEQIAEVIRTWYIEYPDIRDAVVKAKFDVIRSKIKPTKSKPESQEETLDNQTRILEDELEKLKNKPRPQK